MRNRLSIVAIGLLVTAGAFGAQSAREGLLQDGFVLTGIDGKVCGPDSNDTWFFQLGTDANDGKNIAKAGTKIELLPSATLENLTADVNKPTLERTGYRLWGRVTKYKGRNYIFPVYFFALVRVIQPQPPKAEESNESMEKTVTEANVPPKEIIPRDIIGPNDILEIPQEIIEKLKTKEMIQPGRLKEMPAEVNDLKKDSTIREAAEAETKLEVRPKSGQDSILVDRTAFLSKQGNWYVFAMDALGRNAPLVEGGSLRLLPCEALELTEQRQSIEPEPAPFKIAGIMTKFKGRHYLLLQKATRVYNYGNFGR
jgi:hypothetical protein